MTGRNPRTSVDLPPAGCTEANQRLQRDAEQSTVGKVVSKKH